MQEFGDDFGLGAEKRIADGQADRPGDHVAGRVEVISALRCGGEDLRRGQDGSRAAQDPSPRPRAPSPVSRARAGEAGGKISGPWKV